MGKSIWKCLEMLYYWYLVVDRDSLPKRHAVHMTDPHHRHASCWSSSGFQLQNSKVNVLGHSPYERECRGPNECWFYE